MEWGYCGNGIKVLTLHQRNREIGDYVDHDIIMNDPKRCCKKFRARGWLLRILMGMATILMAYQVSTAENTARLDSVLEVLNAEIHHSSNHRREKEARLQALKKDLSDREGKVKFRIADELFREYSSYQSDSAFHYATLMYRNAKKSGNPTEQALANIAFAEYFISVGLFKEASEMLRMIDSEAIPDHRKKNYYYLNSRLYESLCSYVGGSTSPVWSYYHDLSRNYLDSLINVTPEGSYEHASAMISRRQMDGLDIEEAIETRKGMLERFVIDEHEKAISCSQLAHALLAAGRRDEAEYYLGLSAIYDIRSNTTETTAAKMLAVMLHEDGRNEEAYAYIQKAQDDAAFFNTRLRKAEISGELAMIDRALFDWFNGRVWQLWRIVAIIFLLLLLTVVLFFMLRRRKRVLENLNQELDNKTKELSVTNDNLTKLNSELENTNRLLNDTYRELRETTEIKDQYIMQSLYVNTAFVNQVEERCREVVKSAKEGKYDEVKFLPYKMGIKEERQRIYKSFDKAFLKLFPNFIDEMNKLFKDEDRIVLENADSELPMDVRIFALLRLGIDDPTDVARYLNLSTKTIYVYKTKMKSRSTVDNNEFEERIRAIPKP